MHDSIRAHHRHLRAVSAEDQRLRGNQQRRIDPRAAQIDLGIQPRDQRAILIGHLHFNQHGAARRIERVRRAFHRAEEAPSREIGERQPRGLPDMDRAGVVLRNVHVNAQRPHLRDPV